MKETAKQKVLTWSALNKGGYLTKRDVKELKRIYDSGDTELQSALKGIQADCDRIRSATEIKPAKDFSLLIIMLLSLDLLTTILNWIVR